MPNPKNCPCGVSKSPDTIKVHYPHLFTQPVYVKNDLFADCLSASKLLVDDITFNNAASSILCEILEDKPQGCVFSTELSCTLVDEYPITITEVFDVNKTPIWSGMVTGVDDVDLATNLNTDLSALGVWGVDGTNISLSSTDSFIRYVSFSDGTLTDSSKFNVDVCSVNSDLWDKWASLVRCVVQDTDDQKASEVSFNDVNVTCLSGAENVQTALEEADKILSVVKTFSGVWGIDLDEQSASEVPYSSVGDALLSAASVQGAIDQLEDKVNENCTFLEANSANWDESVLGGDGVSVSSLGVSSIVSVVIDPTSSNILELTPSGLYVEKPEEKEITSLDNSLLVSSGCDLSVNISTLSGNVLRLEGDGLYAETIDSVSGINGVTVDKVGSQYIVDYDQCHDLEAFICCLSALRPGVVSADQCDYTIDLAGQLIDSYPLSVVDVLDSSMTSLWSGGVLGNSPAQLQTNLNSDSGTSSLGTWSAAGTTITVTSIQDVRFIKLDDGVNCDSITTVSSNCATVAIPVSGDPQAWDKLCDLINVCSIDLDEQSASEVPFNNTDTTIITASSDNVQDALQDIDDKVSSLCNTVSSLSGDEWVTEIGSSDNSLNVSSIEANDFDLTVNISDDPNNLLTQDASGALLVEKECCSASETPIDNTNFNIASGDDVQVAIDVLDDKVFSLCNTVSSLSGDEWVTEIESSTNTITISSIGENDFDINVNVSPLGDNTLTQDASGALFVDCCSASETPLEDEDFLLLSASNVQMAISAIDEKLFELCNAPEDIPLTLSGLNGIEVSGNSATNTYIIDFNPCESLFETLCCLSAARPFANECDYTIDFSGQLVSTYPMNVTNVYDIFGNSIWSFGSVGGVSPADLTTQLNASAPVLGAWSATGTTITLTSISNVGFIEIADGVNTDSIPVSRSNCNTIPVSGGDPASWSKFCELVVNCVYIEGSEAINVVGTGNSNNPFNVSLNLSEVSGNRAEILSDGLYVSCCNAEDTPIDNTNFNIASGDNVQVAIDVIDDKVFSLCNTVSSLSADEWVTEIESSDNSLVVSGDNGNDFDITVNISPLGDNTLTQDASGALFVDCCSASETPIDNTNFDIASGDDVQTAIDVLDDKVFSLCNTVSSLSSDEWVTEIESSTNTITISSIGENDFDINVNISDLSGNRLVDTTSGLYVSCCDAQSTLYNPTDFGVLSAYDDVQEALSAIDLKLTALQDICNEQTLLSCVTLTPGTSSYNISTGVTGELRDFNYELIGECMTLHYLDDVPATSGFDVTFGTVLEEPQKIWYKIKYLP